MKPDEEYTFFSVTTRNKTGLYRNKQRNKYPARYRPTYKNKAKAGYQEQEGIENDGCGKKSNNREGGNSSRRIFKPAEMWVLTVLTEISNRSAISL